MPKCFIFMETTISTKRDKVQAFFFFLSIRRIFKVQPHWATKLNGTNKIPRPKFVLRVMLYVCSVLDWSTLGFLIRTGKGPANPAMTQQKQQQIKRKTFHWLAAGAMQNSGGFSQPSQVYCTYVVWQLLSITHTLCYCGKKYLELCVHLFDFKEIPFVQDIKNSLARFQNCLYVKSVCCRLCWQ